MPKRRGLIQVYTGTGKGKTTAAWGQALRAIGHRQKVAVVRFLKPDDSGEVKAAECLRPSLSVFGRTSPYDARVDQRDSAILKAESRQNLEIAEKLIFSGEYDMVVLDEINVVLHYDFVARDEILNLLRKRPEHTEIVLTGRYAPQWLMDAADLVTEMAEIKHPARGGVKARKGIEY